MSGRHTSDEPTARTTAGPSGLGPRFPYSVPGGRTRNAEECLRRGLSCSSGKGSGVQLYPTKGQGKAAYQGPG